MTSKGQNLTAGVKDRETESGDDRNWTKFGVIATAIGAVATVVALLVFVIPTRDGRDEAARDASPGTAETTQKPTGTPASTTRPIASNERHLAELPLAQGGGAVRVVDGRDLSMPCGSGQSDDRYREIEYQLPGAYTSFTTQATAGGKADPEASIGIEVFVRTRQERSDRIPRPGAIAIKTSTSAPLTADITDATALSLRITCSASTLNVRFTDPRIVR
jgi:hypothetical protein